MVKVRQNSIFRLFFPFFSDIFSNQVSANAKRTLVLVSKVLQNLSNGLTNFKEGYMNFLEVFMEQNMPLFNNFLDQVSVRKKNFAIFFNSPFQTYFLRNRKLEGVLT